jgi:uncharacterized membrane protein
LSSETEAALNPFDLKSGLLAKHAQHVVLIHFPIALFIASFAFDLLARWRRDRNLENAAYYNLMAAAVATLPAVATGLLAWRWLLGGAKLKGNLRLHLLFGSLSAGMIWMLSWWRTRLRRSPEQRLSAAYLAVELIAVFVVALTGHLGGILSGVEMPPG